jgi:hypothetical protein
LPFSLSSIFCLRNFRNVDTWTRRHGDRYIDTWNMET